MFYSCRRFCIQIHHLITQKNIYEAINLSVVMRLDRTISKFSKKCEYKRRFLWYS